nr:hypothetical protein [Psychrobacter sp.]
MGGGALGLAVAKINDPNRKLQAKNKKRLAEEREDNRCIHKATRVLQDHGVTCRCGGLAIPTEQRGKIRRCVRCNKQFASGGYNLGDTRTAYELRNYYRNNEKLDMMYYDDAVEFLKEEDKIHRSSV